MLLTIAATHAARGEFYAYECRHVPLPHFVYSHCLACHIVRHVCLSVMGRSFVHIVQLCMYGRSNAHNTKVYATCLDTDPEEAVDLSKCLCFDVTCCTCTFCLAL